MVRPKRRRREGFDLPPELSHTLPRGQELVSDPGELAALGIEADEAALKAILGGDEEEPLSLPKDINRSTTVATVGSDEHGPFDVFSKLSNYPEVLMELATHLRIRQFITLYSISKDFHEIVNGHLTHVLTRCAQGRAREAASLYPFKFYRPLCIPDPVGRINPYSNEIRMVPSLKWLQMVYHRERAVRDILALLAREGHRCPKGMALSLKKMWLMMDIATSLKRSQIIHNTKFWTDFDLYNIQLFTVKLMMRFNDPIDGPGDDGLWCLLLGQRGLSPLWRTLRREALKNGLELAIMAARYFYLPTVEPRLSVFGIHPDDVGRGHLEGWGKGIIHLFRPDELVMREGVRRNLQLQHHLMPMMLWGYVDPITRKNIPVSDEEMYMSDDDEEEGGKRWSDVEATRWREPDELDAPTADELNKRLKKKEAREAKEESDQDDWMTDDEDQGEGEEEEEEEEEDEDQEADAEEDGGEDGMEEADEEEDGSGDEAEDGMELDGPESETSDSQGGSSDDGMGEDFVHAMEVDDDGNLVNV